MAVACLDIISSKMPREVAKRSPVESHIHQEQDSLDIGCHRNRHASRKCGPEVALSISEGVKVITCDFAGPSSLVKQADSEYRKGSADDVATCFKKSVLRSTWV